MNELWLFFAIGGRPAVRVACAFCGQGSTHHRLALDLLVAGMVLLPFALVGVIARQVRLAERSK